MLDAEARRWVSQARVARLASHDLSGRLHLVPICFALSGDTLYSAVDDKPKRSRRLRRLANVRVDPDVCVLVDEYDEDWSRLWWVRLRGVARLVPNCEERDRAVALLRAKYEQYAADLLDGQVLAIDVDESLVWSAAT